ncbi:MAG: response regulator [Anaerolineales bacterium]|nr:response regulator [Anaerolineales bacterium]MCS7247870.1 response regulator [Anaerolineales bacterium]MDW8161680.1 response regulator [Anaerolineales bacterium]MDW8447517.1 response regulator [Anaerolineales bacterium]
MAKILVAEDERDIRELIAFTLQFAGHEVITTSNGEEALQAVRTQRPQLVLLDVRMPRMDGYEVCKEIKTDPQTKTIPVIFLSAKGQESEIRSGLEAGAEQYLLKPFSPDQLIEQVNKVLAGR